MKSRTQGRLLSGVFLPTIFIGCLGPLEPDVGKLRQTPCADRDSNGDKTISFTKDLKEDIFLRSDNGCLRCHDPTGGTSTGVELGGLDLSSYQGLLKGGVNGSENIIVPLSPCDSILFLKIRPSPPFGSRMPQGGPFLNQTDETRISDWIAEGANDN